MFEQRAPEPSRPYVLDPQVTDDHHVKILQVIIQEWEHFEQTLKKVCKFSSRKVWQTPESGPVDQPVPSLGLKKEVKWNLPICSSCVLWTWRGFATVSSRGKSDSGSGTLELGRHSLQTMWFCHLG